jgi:hypothetical protein
MANMSYCKFENTYSDLRQCWEEFDDANSESEKKARKAIIKLCKKIVEDYGEEVE